MLMILKYVLAAGVGVGIGYYFAREHLREDFRLAAEREIEEAKYFYRDFYKRKAGDDGEDAGLTEAAVDASEALLEYQGVEVGPEELTDSVTESLAKYSADEKAFTELSELEKPEIQERIREAVTKPRPKAESVNYNAISTPTKATEDAAKKTEPEKPEFVIEEITIDGFMQGQFGYPQHSITYFAGDGVMADENDRKLNPETVETGIGKDNFDRVKAGHDEPMYIRNRTAEREFEITVVPDKYSEAVVPGNQTESFSDME